MPKDQKGQKDPQEQLEQKGQLEQFEMNDWFDSSDETSLKSQEIENESVGDENLYTPNIEHENAVNRTYNSVIRFVKNPRANKTNGNVNIVSKYVCWIPNPRKPDSKIMVDDMSSLGHQNNILTNAFFELYNSKSLAQKNLAQENFGRKIYHFSLAQILKDDQEPDLVGKFKVFRFAQQVDDKINEALKDDEENGIYRKLYSDPIKGHRFIVRVSEQQIPSRRDPDKKITITSYDSCKFSDKSEPLVVDGIDPNWHETPEGKKEMFNYLLENTPVLEDYKPQEWDKQTEELVIQSVMNTINNPALFDKIYFKTYGKSYFSEVEDINDDDAVIQQVEEIEEFEEKPKTKSKPKTATKKTAEKPKDDGVGLKVDDIDDIENL